VSSRIRATSDAPEAREVCRARPPTTGMLPTRSSPWRTGRRIPSRSRGPCPRSTRTRPTAWRSPRRRARR